MRTVALRWKRFTLPLLLVSLAGAQGGWVAQVSGTTRTLNVVRFLDTNTGWALGDSGTILKTTNGGQTWLPRSAGTSRHIRALHFATGSTGWAVGDSGLLLRTTDAGESWSIRPSGTTHGLRTVQFVGDSGWIGGDSGILLRTVNGGNSWTQVGVGVFAGLHARINKLVFKAGGIGYAAAGANWQGNLLRTNDGGVTWTIVSDGSLNGSSEYKDLAYHGDSVFALYAYLALGSGAHATMVIIGSGVFTAGTTRVGLQGVAINAPSSIHFFDSRMGWAAGPRGNILRWTDTSGWVTQRSYDLSSMIHLNSIYFANARTGWAVGVQGTILKADNGGATALVASGASPGTPALHGDRFSYHLTTFAPVRIALRRLDGTIAARLVDGLLPAGAHSLALSGRVPAGLYVLEYRSGAESRYFRALVP